MANLKKITELPVVESTEGLNLIVNDNGEAKQIAADAVGKVKTVNGVEPDVDGNVEVRTQPDWNQNDPTAPDYVKNRPFWTDDLVETVFCDVTVTTMDSGAHIPCPGLVKGRAYTVIFDGVEYNETAWIGGNGMYCIGSDFPFSGEYVDGNTPFCIAEGVVMTVYPDGEHTVKIIDAVEEVHKIDPKYLPNAGGGYDLVINHGTDWDRPVVAYGSYEALTDKILNGIIPMVCIYRHCYFMDGQYAYGDFVQVKGIGIFDNGNYISIDIGDMNHYDLYKDNSVRYIED